MIKKIQFSQFGPAQEVLECVDAPEPAPLIAGEVEIDMILMPLNPSDLMMTRGIYGGAPPALPCDMGREGVGRITAMGPEVSGFRVGDLVMPFTAPTWQSRIVRSLNSLIRLPSGIDLEQAAMLRSGPATAALMLRDYVALQEGDWAIQNVANSSVGTCFAQLAGSRGIKTLNIVRQSASGKDLHDIQGAVVIEHSGGPSDELKQRVEDATGGAPVRLGLDAIAGSSTDALAQNLSNGATLVNYGVLSKEPCQIYGGHLHFRNITMRGFWMSQWLQLAEASEIKELYANLAYQMDEGVLRMAVAGHYSFEQIKEAAAHSAREGRDGKVLIGLK